jgi:class 3 adenylate cyclase
VHSTAAQGYFRAGASEGDRIFKVMGDGLLAEFGSVADAVECAAVLQRQDEVVSQGCARKPGPMMP